MLEKDDPRADEARRRPPRRPSISAGRDRGAIQGPLALALGLAVLLVLALTVWRPWSSATPDLTGELRGALALVPAQPAGAPALEPIFTAVTADDRQELAWRSALLRLAPEAALAGPLEVPALGEAGFGRPVVAMDPGGSREAEPWPRLLDGRLVEREVELEGGLRAALLRSITGKDLPAIAKPGLHLQMRESLGIEYGESDGGGRAWLELAEGDDGSVEVGGVRSWTVVYEAGPLGIEVGGSVFFQASVFWKWSSPQTRWESAPGYTRVSCEADGVVLSAAEVDQGLLRIQVGGRALRAGERVRIAYGVESGARGDSHAERGERFWIGVDGDGDGSRKLLLDSPKVTVRPRDPARLVLTLPTVVRPGERARLVAAVTDGGLNAGCELAGRLALSVQRGLEGEDFGEWPAGLGPEPRVELALGDGGCTAVEIGPIQEEGIYRLRAELALGDRRIEAHSNPMQVSARGPKVFWGDLHGHSNYSDGTGVPEDYYAYARDVAGLDAVALTDHDNWGMLPLAQHPEMWREIQRQAARFDDPGRFVALPGFEWTSWLHGHRHVLYFEDRGEVFSSLDERYDTPPELWAALRGFSALTIPHHPGGGAMPVDWSIEPDPELEPVAELSSVHGSSEATDSPNLVFGPVAGHMVRDALDRGYRLGLVGSGDGHDGHPGLGWEAPHYINGGLVAFLCDEDPCEGPTRERVLEALRGRRVYATNGPRILLRYGLGGRRMGSVVPASEVGETETLFVDAVGTAPIEWVEIIRSGEVAGRYRGAGQTALTLTAEVEGLESGEYVYVRLVQEGRSPGMAWSSPVWVR